MTADLLQHFEPEIESVTLIPSEGGRFEVVINDTLIYSKIATGRHVERGEVTGLVKKYLQERHS